MSEREKIRAEVERLKSNLIHGACSSQIAMETRCKEEAYNEVLAILDTMQEESVSNDFEMALAEMIGKAQTSVVEPWVFAAQWKDELIKLAKSEEPVSEDLGDYINELSKQFTEVSFAKLSRIAVRVAKWQKEQDQSTIELAEDHAMLAGMEKMKEQMMAKAVDAELYSDGMLTPLISVNDKEKISDIKFGDKIKLIIIKDE